ncbi:unnamed protein product [Nezara viridula]|uniref:Neuropeptide n=1 Tax=Nezara viridula TaxID=85310 RepID=A0A9P0E9E1_NEZVI|nr:unnamed protein product [Nezara viridula]
MKLVFLLFSIVLVGLFLGAAAQETLVGDILRDVGDTVDWATDISFESSIAVTMKLVFLLFLIVLVGLFDVGAAAQRTVVGNVLRGNTVGWATGTSEEQNG